MARKHSLDTAEALDESITIAAARLFYEGGYAATSIRDIADAVGISSSSLYYYFNNKQEILHAIVARFMGDFVELTCPILADRALSPTERMGRVIRVHLEVSQRRRPEMLVGNPIRTALAPDQREEGIRLQTIYHDAVRDTIAEGVRRGEFHVDHINVTTMAVLDMINGVREWFKPVGTLSLDELSEHYTTLVFRILGVADAKSA